MKKKYILVFFLICIIFALITYKLLKSGNNISKSDDISILNISSYEATIEVQICSNKNKNKYLINQKFAAPNIFKQEIMEPESLKGLIIFYDGESLNLENKKLDLKKTYENYQKVNENTLSLIRFIEEYKNGEEIEEKEENQEKTIKVKLKNNNKYEKYKKLYIDKNTNLPTKMEILDINQNVTVYILYKEIKINKTSKEDILGK